MKFKKGDKVRFIVVDADINYSFAYYKNEARIIKANTSHSYYVKLTYSEDKRNQQYVNALWNELEDHLELLCRPNQQLEFDFMRE